MKRFVGCIVLLVIVLVIFYKNPYTMHDVLQQEPTLKFLFGTDGYGRDVFSRIVAGTFYSVSIALMSACIATILGVSIGLAAACLPKMLSEMLLNVIDLLNSLPSILYILVASAFVEPGIWQLAIIIGCASWMTIARTVRMLVFAEKEQMYVKFAKEYKTTIIYRISRYYLPVVRPVIGVLIINEWVHAILTEATISFLGLGLPTHTPTLGNLLLDAQNHLLLGYWWNVLFPGAVLALLVLTVYQVKERGEFGDKGRSIKHFYSRRKLSSKYKTID